MSHHRYSRGASCGFTYFTSQKQHQRQDIFHDARRPQPLCQIQARYGAAAELSQMIDDHLASWQASQSPSDRPTSKGTVIVDWDGSGEPIVSYREKATVVEEVLVPIISPAPPRPLNRGANRLGNADIAKQSRKNSADYMRKPLPSLPTGKRTSEQANRKDSVTESSHHSSRYGSVVSEARSPSRRHAQYSLAHTQISPVPRHPQLAHYTTEDGFTAGYHPSRYSPTRGSHLPACIKGYDESTHLEFDYNGHVFHAHRSHDSHPSSPRSTYSDYYAIDVDQYDAQAELRVREKEVLSLPAEQGRKRNNVFRFVEKVLWRLDGLGLMKRLRDERKAARKGGTWKEAGYVT